MQHLSPEKAIGSSFHGIIVKRRQIICAAVEGHRKTAGWIYFSGKYFRKRRSAFRSRIEALDHTGSQLLRKRQRTAGNSHEDNRSSGRRNFFQQQLLKSGQLEIELVSRRLGVECIARLPFDLRIQAEAEDRNLGPFRSTDRLELSR